MITEIKVVNPKNGLAKVVKVAGYSHKEVHQVIKTYSKNFRVICL